MPSSQMFACSESRSPEVSPSGYIRHGMEQVFVRIGDHWIATTAIKQIDGLNGEWLVTTERGRYPVESLPEMWATATTRPGA